MKILDTFLGGFTSWKTTLVGVITAVIVFLNTFHVFTITPEQQGTIIAFAILVAGWIMKDASATGLPTDD